MLGMLYFYCGLFLIVRLFRNLIGERLTIVTYHRVTGTDIRQIEMSLPYLFTSERAFKKQLNFYRTWYKVITFTDLRRAVQNGSIPWNSLIITFDDGYADNYHCAYPALKKTGLPATFFISVDKIGREGAESSFWWDRIYYLFRLLSKPGKETVLRELDHDLTRRYDAFKKNPAALFSILNKEKNEKIENMIAVLQKKLKISTDEITRANATMTWEQIAKVRSVIEFGSHSCSHDNLLTMDQNRKLHEIRESKSIIEQKSGGSVVAFSYPCGNIDENITTLVKDAGYEFAVTTETGINALADPHHLKRINVWEGTSLSMSGSFSKGYFAIKLSGW
jgi:peptidoglycan/xylan/chitin deacetylase (PgdA/CDA1 family)